MKTATVREAQHHLSKLLREVEAGEEIVLTRRGEKIATIKTYEEEEPAERAVDWRPWLEMQKKRMEGIPKLGQNPVLEERESYRY